MSDAGKLVYSKSSGSNAGKLCYKASGTDAGKLVYKVLPGDWTTISFIWGTDGRDLDICAFWNGASSMQMGFGYNESKTEQVSGAYHIYYSGDIKDEDSSEWVRIKMTPWSSGLRTFEVHFNYFRYDSVEHPATTCSVVAAQMNGPFLRLDDVRCSTINGRRAYASDPGVLVTFSESGLLLSLEAI